MPRTPIEQRLAGALEQEGIRFKEQIKVGHYSVDFLILSRDSQPLFVVECDGAAYHDAAHDAARDEEIAALTGFQVQHFSGKQINFSLRQCLEAIAAKLSTATRSPVQEFDPEQTVAVSAPLGPTLVYAPAGSGKTRAIVGRIAYLIQNFGLHPDRICALTFTVDAANEMRKRLADRLSAPLAEQIFVGTFHALAGKLKVSNDRNVPDKDRLSAVLLAATRQAHLEISSKDLATMISLRKGNLLDVKSYARKSANAEHLEGNASNSFKAKFIEAWQFYEDELAKNRECDYDDLLRWLVLKASKDPQSTANLSTLFDYVLVDEAQDNNRAQDEILRLLTLKHSNFMVVGDDDQSIYGFRGAQPKLFRRKEEIPGTRTVFLHSNYRSHPTIVLTALGFITGNNERRLKMMRPTRVGSGTPIEWIQCEGPIAEARALARRISDILEDGFDPADVAILVRSNYQSEVIAHELAVAGILVANHSHDSILGKRPTQVLVSYLKMVAGDRAWESSKMALRYPNRYFPKELRAELRGTREVLDSWEEYAKRLLGTKEEWKAENWQADIEKFRQLSAVVDSPPSEIIATLRKQFSLDNQFDQLIDGKVVLSGKPHLEYFESLAKAFNSIPELLDYCATLRESRQSVTSKERVELMTIHKAKGREFPVVFMVGLNNGQFPHPDGDEQEERRLCYVAISRAREKLVLSEDPQRASAFVAEIKQCAKEPIVILLDAGAPLPRLSFCIGETVFDQTLGKLVVSGYSSLHGICVSRSDGQTQTVPHSVATAWIRWLVRTEPGEMIDGTGFKVGQSVRHNALGAGTIIEYRSDRGFLVDFFVQKAWIPHAFGLTVLSPASR